MTDPNRAVFHVVTVTDWDGAMRFARAHLRDCIFRGQSDAAHSLSTSLERAAAQYAVDPTHLRAIERLMLQQFQRRAHHYVQDPPPKNSYLEWLALMQHHGAPTRLLDFTHSFYVAAFFALETARGDAAVWAIDRRELDERVRPALGTRVYKTMAEHGQRYVFRADEFLGTRPPMQVVFDVEPYRMNERLSIQQGTFLFPADVSMAFEANLAATFGVSDELFRPGADRAAVQGTPDQPGVLPASITEVVLDAGMRRSGVEDLARMNVTAATLFPGLDGFARSLRSELVWWRVKEYPAHRVRVGPVEGDIGNSDHA